MKTEDQLHSMIANIYEAGINPDHWEVVLGEIAAWFGGVGSLIGYRDIENKTGGVPVYHNLDPEVLQTYEKQYSSQDFWAANSLRYDEGSVLTSDMLVDRTALVRSEVYNDYLQKMQVHDLLAVSLANNKSAIGFLSVYRPSNKEGFQSSDIKEMEIIARHLQKAAKISSRMLHSRSSATTSRRITDHLTYPVIVVASDRRLLWANRAAEKILSKEDGLSSLNGKLCALRQKDTVTIDRAIHDALTPTFDRADQDRTALAQRLPGMGFYGLTLIPIRPDTTTDMFPFLNASVPAVAVWVSEPDPLRFVNLSVFELQHKLTKVESNVLRHLVEGHTLQEIAANLVVGKETIRTHLKHIFGKTGTNRQQDLISLVHTTLPPITTIK